MGAALCGLSSKYAMIQKQSAYEHKIEKMHISLDPLLGLVACWSVDRRHLVAEAVLVCHAITSVQQLFWLYSRECLSHRCAREIYLLWWQQLMRLDPWGPRGSSWVSGIVISGDMLYFDKTPTKRI